MIVLLLFQNPDTHNSIPPYLIQLSVNDVLDVVAFRVGDNPDFETKAGQSFVRINYLG
jgi:hypothetical protein